MAISINIADVFQSVFGYAPPEFQFQQLPAKKQMGTLGSPMYGVDDLGKEYYMPAKLGGIDLPHPVIRITGQKNIVYTPMLGLRGSVKEMMNVDDYRILVRGLIISEDNEYPEAVITQLKDLFEAKEALSLRSVITDIFLITPERLGFDKVVIEGVDFPEVPGIVNVRPYELRLVSDEPFDLWID